MSLRTCGKALACQRQMRRAGCANAITGSFLAITRRSIILSGTTSPHDLLIKWKMILGLLDTKKEFFRPQAVALLEDSREELGRFGVEFRDPEHKPTYEAFFDWPKQPF